MDNKGIDLKYLIYSLTISLDLTLFNLEENIYEGNISPRNLNNQSVNYS